MTEFRCPFCGRSKLPGIECECFNSIFGSVPSAIVAAISVDLSVPVTSAVEMIHWPQFARVLYANRIADDIGVGDTADRELTRTKIDKFAWLLKRWGFDCHCSDKKRVLNDLFPYPRSQPLSKAE